MNQGLSSTASQRDIQVQDRKNCASGSASYAASHSAREAASASVSSMTSTRMNQTPPLAWGDRKKGQTKWNQANRSARPTRGGGFTAASGRPFRSESRNSTAKHLTRHATLFLLVTPHYAGNLRRRGRIFPQPRSSSAHR